MEKPHTDSSALKLQVVNKKLGIEPSIVEQILEHNRTGAHLSEFAQVRLQRIQKAWAMLCSGKSKAYVLETIAREHNVDERTVVNDIKMSYEIYGSFDLLEISGKLVARVNFYEKIAQDAYDAEKYDEAIKASKQADMLLLEIQKQNNRKKINPITKWIFKPVNAPEIIEIDYDIDE